MVAVESFGVDEPKTKILKNTLEQLDLKNVLILLEELDENSLVKILKDLRCRKKFPNKKNSTVWAGGGYGQEEGPVEFGSDKFQMNQFGPFDIRIPEGRPVQGTVRHFTGVDCQIVYSRCIDSVVRERRSIQVESVHVTDIDPIILQRVVRSFYRADIGQHHGIRLIHPGGGLHRPGDDSLHYVTHRLGYLQRLRDHFGYSSEALYIGCCALVS